MLWARDSFRTAPVTDAEMRCCTSFAPGSWLWGAVRILGVDFDAKLLMHEACHSCACQAGWRLRTLLRTRRFHSLPEMLLLFRSHVMSFVEFRTPAIAHAASSVLAPIDNVGTRFLEAMNLTPEGTLRCWPSSIDARSDYYLMDCIGVFVLMTVSLRHVLHDGISVTFETLVK